MLPTKVHLVKTMAFLVVMYRYKSWTIRKAECQRTDALELWCWRRQESLGLQGDPPSPSQRRSVLNIHWKDWCWSCSNTLATWCEELTHWKRAWCWKRLKAGGEGDNSGRDGWMASLTWWTWVWESSGSWWWTGRPGVLQSMGSQRVRDDWVTEMNRIEGNIILLKMISDRFLLSLKTYSSCYQILYIIPSTLHFRGNII